MLIELRLLLRKRERQLILDLYETGAAELRRQAKKLYEQYGEDLRDALVAGRIRLSIDLGHARQFVQAGELDRLLKKVKVRKTSTRKILTAIVVTELLLLLALFVMSVVALSWWGLLSFVVLPLLVFACWRSVLTPSSGGALPRFLMFAGITYAILGFIGDDAPVNILIAIASVLLFYSTIMKYKYPSSVIMKLIHRDTRVLSDLIDADVVWLVEPFSFTDIFDFLTRSVGILPTEKLVALCRRKGMREQPYIKQQADEMLPRFDRGFVFTFQIRDNPSARLEILSRGNQVVQAGVQVVYQNQRTKSRLHLAYETIRSLAEKYYGPGIPIKIPPVTILNYGDKVTVFYVSKAHFAHQDILTFRVGNRKLWD